MFTKLSLQNFKSWEDTGTISLAPITGFFGTNSSGKTAILQLLLLLKQTIESADRSRVLHLGDDRTYVDLGTIFDVVHKHKLPGELGFHLEWMLPAALRILDPEGAPGRSLLTTSALAFDVSVLGDESGMSVEQFYFDPKVPNQQFRFGMRRKHGMNGNRPKHEYELISEGYEAKRTTGRPWPLPAPTKCYGFPDQVNAYYQNTSFLSEFVLAFEEAFQKLFYLGPLREYPHRTYIWAGEQPLDVGRRGELAVPALLAAEVHGPQIRRGRGKRRQSVAERVAEWLRELGLIYSFDVRPIAPNRKEYEVRVRRSPHAAEVSITDVGFGVSQILPVLTLCYYAPENATLIFEQPEIHLHPSVQAGLADVFIDVIKTRNIQIILESHSEHLLRRLQRRIAEEELSNQQAALYFIQSAASKSVIEPLDIDLFGNILNWPEHFFGDEMGDLVAMTNAAINRQS